MKPVFTTEGSAMSLRKPLNTATLSAYHVLKQERKSLMKKIDLLPFSILSFTSLNDVPQTCFIAW